MSDVQVLFVYYTKIVEFVQLGKHILFPILIFLSVSLNKQTKFAYAQQIVQPSQIFDVQVLFVYYTRLSLIN